MKRRIITAVTAILMATVLLTGCETSASVAETAKKFGMKEAGELNEIMMPWAGPSEDDSIYYISKNNEESNFMKYGLLGVGVNKGKTMSDPETETEEVVVCIKNKANENYEKIYQITAKNEKSAKKIYEYLNDSFTSYKASIPGEKNGFKHYINWYGGDNVDVIHGVYLKDKTVIYISGFFKLDEGDCTNFFCKQLGLESPLTLKDYFMD